DDGYHEPVVQVENFRNITYISVSEHPPNDLSYISKDSNPSVACLDIVCIKHVQSFCFSTFPELSHARYSRLEVFCFAQRIVDRSVARQDVIFYRSDDKSLVCFGLGDINDMISEL